MNKLCQGDIPEYLIKISKIQSFIIQSRQGARKFLAGGTKFKKGIFFSFDSYLYQPKKDFGKSILSCPNLIEVQQTMVLF